MLSCGNKIETPHWLNLNLMFIVMLIWVTACGPVAQTKQNETVSPTLPPLQPSPTPSDQFYHLRLGEGEQLTHNTFYDGEPDWTP